MIRGREVLSLLPLLLVSCGGVVADDGFDRTDATSTDSAGEPDTSRDSPAEVLPDDTGSGRIDGGPLPSCERNSDCEPSFTTCQSGVCCNGTMIGGRCICGEGNGCLPSRVCCRSKHKPRDAPDECLRDFIFCAGF